MGKKFQILEEKGGSLQFRAECEWEEVSVFRVRIESVGGKGIAERSWFSAFEMKLWAEMKRLEKIRGKLIFRISIEIVGRNEWLEKLKGNWFSAFQLNFSVKMKRLEKFKQSPFSAFQFTFPAKIKTFEKFNISRNPRISIHFPSQNQNIREIQYLKESSHFNSLSQSKSKHSRNSITQGILAFQFTFPAKIKTLEKFNISRNPRISIHFPRQKSKHPSFLFKITNFLFSFAILESFQKSKFFNFKFLSFPNSFIYLPLSFCAFAD